MSCCGAHWVGADRAHCCRRTGGCGHVFDDAQLWDAHRVWGICLDPRSREMVHTTDGIWLRTLDLVPRRSSPAARPEQRGDGETISQLITTHQRNENPLVTAAQTGQHSRGPAGPTRGAGPARRTRRAEAEQDAAPAASRTTKWRAWSAGQRLMQPSRGWTSSRPACRVHRRRAALPRSPRHTYPTNPASDRSFS
jgi:hypothetical protein